MSKVARGVPSITPHAVLVLRGILLSAHRLHCFTRRHLLLRAANNGRNAMSIADVASQVR